MILQRHDRHVRRLMRQSMVVVVIIVSSLAGLMVVWTHRMFFESERISRALIETASSSDSNSCRQVADWETNGGIVLYLMALGYFFVSLAIICDEYFVVALEKITHKLALPPDVTGATFMAVGSSAPELFVSLADNVFRKPAESLGVGAVVGSGIFNILVIVSLSGLLAGQVLQLDWRPLLRDLLWYTWAIAVLAFAVYDGNVDILDSVIMVCSYASYIGYMTFSERVVNYCCKRPEKDEEQEKQSNEKFAVASKSTSDATSTAQVIIINEDVQRPMDNEKLADNHQEFLNEQNKTMLHSTHDTFPTQQLLHHIVSVGDQSVNVETPKSSANVTTQDELVTGPPAAVGKESPAKYFDVILVPPAGILAKMWFVFTWPIVALARITIPDCRYPAFSGPLGFSATFVVSIIWMGVLSYYTITVGTMFGCVAGIPSTLMGLTIIAIGTSIPDALSSILVARDGHGDMAISNAFGSNVFDILLGLGLPFLLSNIVYGESVVVSGDDLDIAIAILFAVLLFVVLVLVSSHWRLYPLACIFFLMLYVTYVIISYLHTLDLF